MPRPDRRGHGSPRQEYRGRLRFTHAERYETDREWRRYEGTPQRDLLRMVRERFLLRALRGVEAKEGWTVEVGPGPGRFTPLLLACSTRLVLLDLSRAMLSEARARAREEAEDLVVESVLGDAARLPLKEEAADLAVALGNVVGFSGERSLAALQEIAGLLSPGGLLVIETVGATTAHPRFVSRVAPGGWRTLLREDPTRGLPPRLGEGMVPAPPSERETRSEHEFQFLAPGEVARFLGREGFEVRDQMIAAPLTGGDAALVRTISSSCRGDLRPLVHWEETAGRFPAVLGAGGHTLTFAVAR